MPHNAAARNADLPGSALPANGTIIEMSFKATFRWVRRAIHETMDALESTGLTAEDLGSVEIVLAEALNNIVEHAYPQGEPGDISLSLRRRNTGLMVEVRDSGRPMPNGRAPIGNHPMAEFQDDPMPEGGYGWFLIRELVQDLIYDRSAGENFLIFRLAVGTQTQSQV
ncbi:MAG: ATP-binding protein [Silicimonas sp.]|nr:ATP-binding protein [Silicimonas sp.]NNF91700.1 ATP-binding protein [Boseongicola sp.]NND17437.1 ATP-binding protein [Silicimonas sp.]NND20578.1 ATP-binding protein [Silicimonas sp.]NND43367.1 ATP-binding protein [Silicimonas sp.]